MSRSWPSKDPDDILDYVVDWTRRLDAGDTISDAEFTLATDAGLTVQSSSFTNTTATVWLINGNAGETASIRCRIDTAGGRRFDQTISLPIAEK